MSNEQELTEEELHRNALRAHLAEVAAESRERRRMEAMLMRVADKHAYALAQQLTSRMQPRPARRMRRWLWRLKQLVLSPFFRPNI